MSNRLFAPAVLACALAGWASLAAAAPAGVDLLSAGPSAIRIGVAVPAPELTASQPTRNPDGTATPAAPGLRLRVDGWENEGVPGGILLPVRVVRVAVPPLGTVSVSAFGSQSEIRNGIDLAVEPVSKPMRAARPVVAGAPRTSLAPERATLLGVSWMRNQRVATVAIHPVDYDPASRLLTSYARVEVEVLVRAGAPAGPPAEADDPFESVYAATLVNYEQGKAWRRPAAAAAGLTGTRVEQVAGLPVTIDDTSIFAGHTWVKLGITQTGFHRVTFGQLRALNPFSTVDSIAFDSLRVYAWPGLPTLDEDVPCDSCDYRQVAIAVEDDGGDGKLKVNSDAFSFYALGPNDWANHFDPSFADSVWIQHPYETKNYVYLSFGRTAFPAHNDRPFSDAPARIVSNSYDVTPNPGGGEATPTTFAERLHVEQDIGNEYYPNLWSPFFPADGDYPWSKEKFMWRTMSAGTEFSQLFRAPGADPSIPAHVRGRSWGVLSDDGTCTTFYPPHVIDLVVASPAGYDSTQRSWFGTLAATAHVFPLLDTLNTLKVRVPRLVCAGGGGRIDQSAFSWFDVFYARRFVPDGGVLTFDSPGQGNVIYTIGPFPTSTLPRMYDVTDPFAPREMRTDSAAAFAAGGNYLRIEVNETGPRRYAFFPNATSAYRKPAVEDFAEASSVSLENLRSLSHAADYLVLYYDTFLAAADSLAEWRKTRLPIASHPAPYHVKAIPVSAIFDQFSGGRVDPAAIRNFLYTVFYNWRLGGHNAPAYVTLLGDASFDYRNLLGLAGTGQPGCLMPSFENSWQSGLQYATDDWLLNVHDPTTGAVPDFFGGRIPASDAATAMDYVRNKALFYERSSPNGAYRNRVMFIADDDLQADNIDRLAWAHLQQTSRLDSTFTPQHIDRAYVYLHTYPDGPGRTKPLAKAEIKNFINGEGVVMFNYIGHGSPFKLSDENVLIDTDAGTFTNSTKLPLFVAASCDVGKFNDPRVQSLGERMLFSPNGGAVGVISATEVAYSSLNVSLNNELYNQLFERDPATGEFKEGVSTALLAAKLLNSSEYFSIQNNQKYTLMGDAGLKLILPRLWVEVALYDETGTTPVTQLTAGQTLTCKGRVLDRAGGSPVAYSGVVDLLIEDSAPRQTSPDCVLLPGCPRAVYDFRAGAIFRGDLLVTGGTFSSKFVVPLESRGGPRGRVRAYIGGLPTAPPQTDGVGSVRVQVAPGNAPPGDDAGPAISLSFAGNVTSVRPDATLRIELSDPSGILTTGHTIQNGIVVTVDDNTTARVDVTSSFRYAAGSYTTGAATFALPNLSPGKHTVKVSAADNLAAGLNALVHRSTAELTFDVASAPPIAIRNAYLFPNPTESGRRSSGGQFVIDGPGDSVNVQLRIYTISGRLIRELKSLGSFGQVQITWDGYDAEGYPLANGTYLFKVYVNGRDERGRSTARLKAAREGRFVILNH